LNWVVEELLKEISFYKSAKNFDFHGEKDDYVLDSEEVGNYY
jgi:hypothetical protein